MFIANRKVVIAKATDGSAVAGTGSICVAKCFIIVALEKRRARIQVHGRVQVAGKVVGLHLLERWPPLGYRHFETGERASQQTLVLILVLLS
jgi:hypothetical protein